MANAGAAIVGQGLGAKSLREAAEEGATQEAYDGVRGSVGIGAHELLSWHLAAQTVTRSPKVKPREEDGACRVNDTARSGHGRS